MQMKQSYAKAVEQTFANGGFTHSVMDGRYSVGTGKESVIIPEDQFNASTLKDAVHRLRAIDYGTWLHKGEVHIDSVTVYHELDTALKEAKERNEIAIYDLEDDEEIFL